MAPTTRSRTETTTTPTQAQPKAPNRASARAKRTKLQHSSSPDHSALSDDSAMIPTSVPEDTTDASDVDSDVSSEVSESSDESSDGSEEEDEDSAMEDADASTQNEAGVVNLRANRGKKPAMKLEDEEMEDIRPFLKDFLPKLKAANEELEAQKLAGTLETAEIIDDNEDGKDGDAEEQYIELNLGLGVLEAENENASKTAGDKEDNDEGEEDLLGKLMGREKAAVAAGVQVVEEQEPK